MGKGAGKDIVETILAVFVWVILIISAFACC